MSINLLDFEAYRAFNAVRFRECRDECPKCSSFRTIGLEDGADFACKDCGHAWLQASDREYRREPELNPDR
jgi:transposase-like protein